MRVRKGVAARAVGIATSAVVVSLATAGVAAAAPGHGGTAAGSAQVANNTLIINGTALDDIVTLDPGSLGHVVVNINGSSDAFDVSTFNAVAVDLGTGNDAFTESPGILAGVPLTLHAGRGDDQIQTQDTTDLVFGEGDSDTIRTGKGVDQIFGGSGNDLVDGGAGNDFASLGQGKDSFEWEPGEGSDTIDGGAGHADVLQFDGSDLADDVAKVSANGHRALFERDPAGIRMDMDNFEQINYQGLGGADTLTVNDLRGTDIRRINYNPGVFGGFPDGALDNVIVNGSDHPDHISLTGDGTTVDVAGMHAETTITGVDPTDQLHVNTQDGNDTVAVDASATALMDVTTDLGAGQH